MTKRILLLIFILNFCSGSIVSMPTLSEIKALISSKTADKLDEVFKDFPLNKVIDEENLLNVIHLIALSGTVEQLNKIIEIGSYISLSDVLNRRSIHGNSALHLAVVAGNHQVLRRLLELGARVDIIDADEATPFLLAVFNNDIESMRILHEFNADINRPIARQRTALHLLLLRSDNEALVRVLIELNADVNAVDDAGAAPLHVAVGMNRRHSIETLLEAGAHINQIYNHRTPLIIAIQHGNWPAIEILLDYGADVNCSDNEARTIIHYAIKHGHGDIAIRLLRFFPHLATTIDSAGLTPLHYAAQYNLIDVVRYLVEELHVPTAVQDQRNRTPGEIAQDNNHQALARYLGVEISGEATPNIPIVHAEDQIRQIQLIIHQRAASSYYRGDMRRFLGHAIVLRQIGQRIQFASSGE